MKNTERFYNHVRWYLDAVGQITNEYNDAMSRAKQYEGSTGGKALVDQATATRDAAMKAEREPNPVICGGQNTTIHPQYKILCTRRSVCATCVMNNRIYPMRV